MCKDFYARVHLLCVFVFLLSLFVGLPTHSQILFTDDFDDGNSSEWLFFSSGWQEADGVMHATNTAVNRPVAAVVENGFCWTDYAVESDVTPLAGSNSSGANILFRFLTEISTPPGEFCLCALNQGSGQRRLHLACNGGTLTNQLIPFAWQPGETHRLRATAQGDLVTCEVVGEPGAFLTATVSGLQPSGTVGLRGTHIPVDYDNFVVTSLGSATSCNDGDEDGVPDDLDVCSDTLIPEGHPTVRLGVNRWALVDGDESFDTTLPRGQGPGRSFTVEDTAGCSCEQIVQVLGLGTGHEKFGCSTSAMDTWLEIVNP